MVKSKEGQPIDMYGEFARPDVPSVPSDMLGEFAMPARKGLIDTTEILSRRDNRAPRQKLPFKSFGILGDPGR